MIAVTVNTSLLELKVAERLGQDFADADYPTPDPLEVVTAAFDTAVDALHHEARRIEACPDADACGARGVVLRHLADWVAALAREVRKEGES